MQPILDHALALIDKGVSLIAYEVNAQGRKIPWCSWKVDTLPINTAQKLIEAAKSHRCHGFQFRAIDAGWCVVDLDIKGGKDGVKSLSNSARDHGFKIDESFFGRFFVETPNNGYHIYTLADEYLSTISDKGILEGVDILCDRSSLVVVPGSTGQTKDGEWKHYKANGHFDNIEAIPTEISSMFKRIRLDRAEAKRKAQEEKMALATPRLVEYESCSIFEEARKHINIQLIELLFRSDGAYWDGKEYWTKNPSRPDNSVGSFSINSHGLWHDFSNELSGDLILLLSDIDGSTKLQAAEKIIRLSGRNPDDFKGKIIESEYVKAVDWDNILAPVKQEPKKDPQATACQKLKISFGSDIPQEYIPPDEIIQDMIVSRSVTVIYGDSNSGKTFWALSMAAMLSEGMDFHGKKTDKGIVIYLAVEAPETIKTRIQALKRYHGKDFGNIAIVPVPLNFYSGEGHAKQVIEAIKEINETRGTVRMVIGDTLARMSSGANENSGEDMGPVMERFSSIAEQTGASVVIIHHTGKDQAKGARGWSGIRAHIDTEIEVSEQQGAHLATVTKQRSLSSKDQVIPFSLHVMEMGFGKFGNISTTCVAIPSDVTPVTKESEKERKDKDDFKAAWIYSGMETNEQDRPIVTKQKLVEWLVINKGLSDGSASNETKIGNKGRWINRLESLGLVEAFGRGFIVSDDFFSIELNLAKRSKIGINSIKSGISGIF